MARKKDEAPVDEVVPGLAKSATDEALMGRYFALKDWLESEEKRFKTHVAPHKHELEVIEQEFLSRLNDRGANNTKTDFGTAYKSTLLNVAVSPEGATYYRLTPEGDQAGEPFTGRDALFEAALDNWEAWGNEMLMISAQKDAVKTYMEEHDGNPPPGVKTSFFTRVNIKRS